MKPILSCIICLAMGNAYAQTGLLPRIESDTFYSASGYRIGKGQTIKLGRGSSPYGNFLYINYPETSLLQSSSTQDGNGLNKRYAGRDAKITKVWKDKKGRLLVRLSGFPVTDYVASIEQALESGEVTDPFKPDGNLKSSQMGSVADELQKLSDLRDKGILTQEEFDAQKTKLLAK